MSEKLTIEHLEEWKDISGYEGVYQVSSDGRVRSLDRIVSNKGNGANCKTKGRILKPGRDRGGYLYVGLVKDKIKTNSVKVHRLVALAFCDGHEDGLEVNHKDGNRANNVWLNLEWVTRSGNIRDTFKRGRDVAGDKNNSAKLKNEYIDIIVSLYGSGVTQSVIAKSFGVSQATISHVICNKHYK